MGVRDNPPPSNPLRTLLIKNPRSTCTLLFDGNNSFFFFFTTLTSKHFFLCTIYFNLYYERVRIVVLWCRRDTRSAFPGKQFFSRPFYTRRFPPSPCTDAMHITNELFSGLVLSLRRLMSTDHANKKKKHENIRTFIDLIVKSYYCWIITITQSRMHWKFHELCS